MYCNIMPGFTQVRSHLSKACVLMLRKVIPTLLDSLMALAYVLGVCTSSHISLVSHWYLPKQMMWSFHFYRSMFVKSDTEIYKITIISFIARIYTYVACLCKTCNIVYSEVISCWYHAQLLHA